MNWHRPFFLTLGTLAGSVMPSLVLGVCGSGLTNFAKPANGGQITNVPTVYSGAYPAAHGHDGNTGTRWLTASGTYQDAIELSFNPGGVVSNLVLTGDASTSQLRQFMLYAQAAGDPAWYRVLAGSGAQTGYNFAAAPNGGQMVTVPAVYSASYPAIYINDATASTRWLSTSGVYRNIVEWAFDPNLNGTSRETADLFSLTGVALTGDGASDMAKDFRLDVKQDGGTWTPLLSAFGLASGYDFASVARGGQIVNAPSVYSASYPSAYINDGTANTRWLSASNLLSNTIQFAFDPDLNGTPRQASDLFTLTGVALTGDGASDMIRRFKIDVKQSGGTWRPMFASSGPVNDFNFAITPSGGQIVNTPSVYSASYPSTYINDGTANTRWLSASGTFTNTIDFAFDPNLDGSTRQNNDRFTINSVALTGDGASDMVKNFRIDVKQNGGAWTPLAATSGVASNYNFAATANGGQIVNTPSTYSASYPSIYINDGTANTRWLSASGTYLNALQFAFDADLNGTPRANQDKFTLTAIALTGDGANDMIKTFSIDVKQDGGAWQRLYAASGVVSGYNFAPVANGGQLSNSPSTYSASYPASYLLDGTANTRWLSASGTLNNNLDLAFDPNLDGTTALAGDAADVFSLSGVTITNDGTTAALRTFDLYAKTTTSGGVFVLVGSDYAANQVGSSTVTLATPLANTTAVRIRTKTNYGQSYVGISEIAVLGAGSANQSLFSTTMNASRQVFVLNAAVNPGRLNDITDVRVTSYDNYGQAYVGINEIEIIGTSNMALDQPVFTTNMNSSRQVFDLTTANNNGRRNNITDVRMTTLDNYGQSYVGINEIELIGDTNNTVNQAMFTAAMNSSRQLFSIDPTINSGKLINISDVQITTVDNYGQSYVGINQIEVLGNSNVAIPQPVFSTTINANRQLFSLDPIANAGRLSQISDLRLTTYDNFGQSYVGLNEFEVLGNGNASVPLFTLAQGGGNQTVTPDTALNPIMTSNLNGMRLITVNNYGNGYVGLNEFEVCGTPPGVAAAWDCTENGLAYVPNATPPATRNPLYTRLAGAPFSFDVVALKSDGSVQTNFAATASKSVQVELVNGAGSTACAVRAALSPAVTQTLTFVAADQGRKSLSPLTTSKAYSNLRCRVTDSSQSPTVTSCSADSFAVRPNTLTVSASANADASGSSISASPAVKAGGAFTLTAASATAGYDGTPQIAAAQLAAHAGAVRTGNLSGAFGAANPATGSAIGSALTYSEVGYFRLGATGVFDDSFTAVDAALGDCTADFSNTPSGGKVGCKFGNTAATDFFGRFVPDHFSITAGLPANGCGAFTYFGQAFSNAFTLQAHNGTGGVTENYTGSWARFPLANWLSYGFAGSGGLALTAGTPLQPSGPTGSWALGSASVEAAHVPARPAAPASPDSLTVTALPVDPDGVTLASATAVGSAVPLRFGRLRLSNAFGTDFSNLSVLMLAQYWSGSGWLQNSGDNCSAIPPSAVNLSDWSGGLSAANMGNTHVLSAGALVNGQGRIIVQCPYGTCPPAARPASRLTGGVSVAVNLAGSGADNACLTAHGGSGAGLPWLRSRFGACATAHDRDPAARLTFGIFAPESGKVVHSQELF